MGRVMDQFRGEFPMLFSITRELIEHMYMHTNRITALNASPVLHRRFFQFESLTPMLAPLLYL